MVLSSIKPPLALSVNLVRVPGRRSGNTRPSRPLAASKPATAPSFTDFADSLIGMWQGEGVHLQLQQPISSATEAISISNRFPSSSEATEVWRVCGGAISAVQDCRGRGKMYAEARSADPDCLVLKRAEESLVCFSDGSWSSGPLHVGQDTGGLHLITAQIVGRFREEGGVMARTCRARVSIEVQGRNLCGASVLVEGRGVPENLEAFPTGTKEGCEILRCCPGGPGGMSWMEMHRKWSSCSADGSTKDNSLVLAGELRCTVEEAEGGGLAVGVWWGHQHGIIRSYNGSGRLAEVARLQPTGSL